MICRASADGHAAVVIGLAGCLIVPVPDDMTLLDLAVAGAALHVAQGAELTAGILDTRVAAAGVGGAPCVCAATALATAAMLSAAAALAAAVVRLRVTLAGGKANPENARGQKEANAEVCGARGRGMSDHFYVVVMDAVAVHAATLRSEVLAQEGLLLRVRAYSKASISAAMDASMMFADAPTVLQVPSSSRLSMRTRVMAAVPEFESRMRTL